MSDVTAIEWTDHTFNPWWGCSRVSPACRFCYADRDAQRNGHQVWRRHGPRRMLSEANWQRPLRWNRDAERAGIPAKVFCASMADVFEDHPDVAAPRERLWGVIEATPWLTWQLLTKRPENIARMVPWGSEWPPHVWVGTSVENQRYADERIPVLVSAAVQARIRFLSCEPLLGPVDCVVLRTATSPAGPRPSSFTSRGAGAGSGSNRLQPHPAAPRAGRSNDRLSCTPAAACEQRAGRSRHGSARRRCPTGLTGHGQARSPVRPDHGYR